MTSNFIPAIDHVELGKRYAAALAASAELLAVMAKDLPPDRMQAMSALLDGGGRVGIEATVDKAGTSRAVLIGIEREGARRVLAEVAAPQHRPH